MMLYSLQFLFLVPVFSWTLDDPPPWWSRALASLPSVCVLNNTCHTYSKERLDSDYNDYHETGWTPCCTGCSCHQNCHLEGNCCIPPSQEYPDRSRQKCIHDYENTLSVKSYYMYVECEPTVTGVQNVIDQNRLHSLQPVYSKTTGRIYYNKTIALCNGIIDGEEWVFKIDCPQNYFNDLETIDLGPSTECNWMYEYPGDASDIRTEECKTEDLIKDCDTGQFSTPPGFNMTREEIIEACESGYFSTFIQQIKKSFEIYANVFCYICNGGEYEEDGGMCPIRYSADGKRDNLYTFAFTVVFGSSDEMTPAPQVTAYRTKLACSFSSTDSDDCRPVSCPSGQQLRPSGECDFLMETLIMKKVHLYVKLQVADDQQLAGDLLQYVHIDRLTYIDTPWLGDGWKLAYVYCETKDNSTATNICLIHNLIVVLESENIEVKPRQFFDDIQNRLKMNWFWLANDRLIRFNQTILVHPLFVQLNYNTSLYFTERTINDKWKVENDNNIYMYIRKEYVMVMQDSQKGEDPLLITKMFYCEQIVLEPHEYELQFSTLQYKTANTTLYNGEFLVSAGTVRICLFDSVLRIKDSTLGHASLGHPSGSISLITICNCLCVLISVYIGSSKG